MNRDAKEPEKHGWLILHRNLRQRIVITVDIQLTFSIIIIQKYIFNHARRVGTYKVIVKLNTKNYNLKLMCEQFKSSKCLV